MRRCNRDASDPRRLLTSTNSLTALFRALLAAAIAISCIAASAPSPAPSAVEIPTEVADYASAMDKLRTSHGKGQIAPVFEAGMQVSPQVQAVLPDLSEAQYQEVQRKMQGFIVVRESTTSRHWRTSRAPRRTAPSSTYTRAPNPTVTDLFPPTYNSRPANPDARASTEN